MKSFKLQWKEITEKLHDTLEKVIVDAAGRTYQEMVDKTPVDSGALRRAWEIDYGQGYLDLASNYQTKFNAETFGIDYTLGDEIWVRNQKRYAERIEYGYSRQAPAGMMRISIKKYKQFLNEAVAKYKF